MLYRRTVLFALAVASMTAGCKYFRLRPDPGSAEPSSEPAPSAPADARAAPEKARPVGSLKDANIAAMLLASNNTDISYARLVPTRAQRDDVKKFAERMLTDHTGVNALVVQLLTKLDLGPEDNLASLDMRDESASRRDIMRELSGFTFDSTYIDNELRYHRRFLESIDNVMLPAARNEDLKNLLTTVRPVVAAHLAHAEQVWADVMSKR